MRVERVYMYVRRIFAGFRRLRIPGTGRFAPLQAPELRINRAIGHYRSRVEQVIAVLKNHRAMSKGGETFRGDLSLLEAIVTITMHATAALIAEDESRQSEPFPSPAAFPGGWGH